MRTTRAPFLLWAAFGVFTALLVVIVARSLVPRDAQQYAPSPIADQAIPETLFVDTITVDARHAERWAFVDLERRSALARPDTSGWDLAFRRFEIVTSGAALGMQVPFGALRMAPDTAYVETAFDRDTSNAALEEWYRYSFMSHLLNPRPNTYVIRTSTGRYAKIGILGYYCPEMAAGCLTFQYAYQPDGSRVLHSAP